ncbi:MAG: HAMP domain-containing histidine kinase [Anaerolineae bacterium]|nr:HAMP domain-containing histidine kinase [Anaerolineae bacterium]
MFRNPYPPADRREREVGGLLRVVNEFGTATERFFGRVYRSLDRKQEVPKESMTKRGTLSTKFPTPSAESEDPAKEARDIAIRLQAVFATISEGVIVQDNDGRVVLMNDAAYRLLGSTKAFWESELGRMFEHARNLPQMSELETLGSPVRVQVNNRILGAQLAMIAPEGTRLGTLIVLRDVTKEALADRLKDEFVTQLTHELRTPLTAIKGMSEVLLSQPADRPPNRKFLEAIGRNAAIVDRMIIELLDISEISAGSFSIRKQDIALDDLIFDVLKGQQPRLDKGEIKYGLMFVSRVRPRIIGDDRRLRWALGHLIDNSINYTPPGGSLKIKVSVSKGDRIQIQVQDSGVGISDKDLPHVFERFYRGEARTSAGKVIDPRGLGQGLYIARAVAEAHGGFLVCSSTVGQGSLFKLGLPFVPIERKEQSEAS